MITNNVPIAQAPEWLERLAGAAVERDKPSLKPLVEPDQDSAIERAISYLTTLAPEAIEGQGGDEMTYKVAARLKDIGIPSHVRAIVMRIREEKTLGVRSKPSSILIDKSQILTHEKRQKLLDRVASLVDENLSGRSDMCMQFAELLYRGLVHLGLPAKAVLGTAIYYNTVGTEIFRWPHAWVRIGEEVVDGNVDSLIENPVVPAIVRIAPYWGEVKQIPSDRKLREEHGATMAPDGDVSDIWWPELRVWLDQTLIG